MPSAMPVRRRALATILSALLVAAGAVGVVAAPPASAATQDVASATLDWGVKQSFRSYIAGPIANGTATPAGGVVATPSGYAWSAGAGSADAATATAAVSLPGSLQFQGHGGLLDLTLTDARVEIVSATEGYLVFDVASKGLQSGSIEQYPDTRFAQIDLSGLVVGTDAISIAGAPSTLTATGAAAFAGFYAEGTALDPVTFTLPLVAVPEPTDPGTDPTDPGTDPTDPGTDPTDPGTDPTDPGTDPTDPGTDPTDPGTTPTTPADPTHDVAGATLDWTFNAGWLRYQSAAGQITAEDGATFHGAAAGFSWADGTGVVDAGAQSALVALPGTIGFFAHGGVIDIDLTNLRIEIVSATEGYLVVDSTSSTNGTQQDLRLATIDLSGAVFGADAVTVAGAATAITAEAAPIFTYAAGTSFGTATFTLPLAAIEAPVDPTDPGTDPGTDPTDPGTEPTNPGTTPGLGIAGATLQWGIKTSFRSYVQGPIANGTITPTDGVTVDASGFSWTNGSGVADEAAGTALVAYPGQIRFSGHGGQLDLTISDVRLRIDSATQATIVASTVSRSLGSSEYVTQTGVDFATVALSSPAARDAAAAAVAAGTLTIANAPAVLTEQGAAGFAGFYAAGTALDPVSATLPIAVVAEPQQPGTPVVPQQPTPIAPPIVTPGPVQAAPVQGAALAGQQQEQCTATAVSGATLDWGIRSSFRSYISGGIANGGWTTSGGIADADGGWQWSGGSGAIQLDERTGLVSLPGSIHFTGHSGALDLTISDVRLRLTGPSTGTIIADVASKGLEDGQLHTYADIAFASLSFSSTVAGGALSVQGASATLTAAGAEGFAGFYDAGEALDAVSFALPLGGEVECSTATGTLPQTGSEQRVDVLLPMLGLALALMGGVLVARRRLARA